MIKGTIQKPIDVIKVMHGPFSGFEPKLMHMGIIGFHLLEGEPDSLRSSFHFFFHRHRVVQSIGFPMNLRDFNANRRFTIQDEYLFLISRKSSFPLTADHPTAQNALFVDFTHKSPFNSRTGFGVSHQVINFVSLATTNHLHGFGSEIYLNDVKILG